MKTMNKATTTMGKMILAATYLAAALILFAPSEARATTYYVTTTGNDGNTGLSEPEAWRTIFHAAETAQAGDTVYIKGGDYGHEHVVVENSGTAANPIVFEGYDGTPVINGQDGTGTGIAVNSKDHIIIRNIEVTRYQDGIKLDSSEYVILDNITAIDFYPVGVSWSGAGIYLDSSENCTIQNSTVTDAAMEGIIIFRSHYNLVDNCSVYSFLYDPNTVATDYYIVVAYGHDNIVRNCYVENAHGQYGGHPGHGIGIKDNYYSSGSGYPWPHSHSNQVIDCEVHGIQESFFAAHFVYNNLFVNCRAYRDDLATDWNIGFNVRDGAYHNSF